MNQKLKGRLLSLLVLVIVALVVFQRQQILSFFKKETGVGNLRLSTVQEFMIQRDPADPMNNIFGGSGALAFTDKGQLMTYNNKGQIQWTHPMNDGVFLTKNKDRWLIAEQERGNIYVFDNKGELLGSSLGHGELGRVRLQGDNKIVFTDKGNRSLTVLDEKMQENAAISIDRGSIIHQDVASQDNRMTLLILDDSGTDVKSYLRVYNLSGELLQELPMNELALSSAGHGSKVYVVFPSRITRYGGEEEMKEEDFDLLLDKVASARRLEDVLFIATGSSDPLKGLGEPHLTAFSLSNEQILFQNKIRENYDNIDMEEDLVALSYKNLLEIYNMKGNLLYSQEQNQVIRRLYLLGSDHLALVFPDRIAIMKIKY